MIGLDTNVLVRAILNDDATWSPIAQRFLTNSLTADRPGYINLVTLAELIWTLRKSGGYTRAKLAEIVTGLLAAQNLTIERSDLVARALCAFQTGGPGLVDCLIAELNKAAGAPETVTIDGQAKKSLHFIPLT